MKTFKRESARTDYFETKEDYQEFVEYWSSNFKGTSASEQFLYLALRGKDIGKAFTPITNKYNIPSKGDHPYYGLYRVYGDLLWNFSSTTSEWDKKRQLRFVNALGGYVSAEQLSELIKSIPHPKEWESFVK